MDDERPELLLERRPGDLWSNWLLVEDYIGRARPVTVVVRAPGSLVLVTPPGGGFGMHTPHAIEQFCHLILTGRTKAGEVWRDGIR